MASQMNLIRYCLEKPGPPYYNGGAGAWKKKNHRRRRWLMMIAKMLCMEEMADDLVFVRQVKLIDKEEEDPSSTVSSTRPATWEAIRRAYIKQVSNRRGAGVLLQDRHLIREALGDPDKMEVIMESVESRGLDESLLLWHIATDLCFICRDGDRSPPGAQVEDQQDSRRRMLLLRMRAISEILSEYMLYLLIKQPDMLSASAGIELRPYRDTCAEARRFFASMSKDEDARQALLRVNTSEKPVKVKGDWSKSVLFDGVILAKVLLELRLVSGVWGEMLTSAAINGRGLNRGGELITVVWLLTHHMGLSDKYEIQQEDEDPRGLCPLTMRGSTL